jgi:hypothetical protein
VIARASLVLVRGRRPWEPGSDDGILSYVRDALENLNRVGQTFDPGVVPGVVMSDHVPDDEFCWCGVPLDWHDDLYDSICGWHHQPDPIAPPLVSGNSLPAS